MATADSAISTTRRYCRPQPPEITRYIEELVGRLKGLFLEGHLQTVPCEEEGIIEKSRDIYYDTDGIQERQHEKIRSCHDCAGALSIASTSNLGQHILAIHIPVGACTACRETGSAWFEEGTRGAFSRVYLQDRVRGVYERT